MIEAIIDTGIKLGSMALLGFGLIFIKKLMSYVQAKLDIQLSDSEEMLLDNMIEQSVRATEEQTRDTSLKSSDKEELALTKVNEQLGKIDIAESTLRTKIKANVNYLYNRDRK